MKQQAIRDGSGKDEKLRLWPAEHFDFVGFRVVRETRDHDRIIRGGSWAAHASFLRSEGISRTYTRCAYNSVGFRIVK